MSTPDRLLYSRGPFERWAYGWRLRTPHEVCDVGWARHPRTGNVEFAVGRLIYQTGNGVRWFPWAR